MAGLAFRPNIAAALFHDAVNGGKAEAGTFPLFFRCEKWFEDARTRFRVHAMSRISNDDRNVLTRREECLWFSGARSDRNIPGFDSQATSLRHGVAGIPGEVQD